MNAPETKLPSFCLISKSNLAAKVDQNWWPNSKIEQDRADGTGFTAVDGHQHTDGKDDAARSDRCHRKERGQGSSMAMRERLQHEKRKT
jgi:hypothetical protein